MVVLLVPLMLAFAYSVKAGMTANDTAITSGVQEKLQGDSQLKDSKITVDTKEGEVTLKGTVNSQAVISRAAKLARYVDGAKKVDNRLTTENSHHYGVRTPTLNCAIGDAGDC